MIETVSTIHRSMARGPRLHQEKMRLLVTAIVSGIYPAGAYLPREADLATQYDVSRGVARETIRALEERGLIRVVHGKGAIVNESSRWRRFDPDVLAAMLDGPQAIEILTEYLECRQLLEVEGAALAAVRRNEDDLSAMRDAFARMEKATKLPASAEAEDRFHRADLDLHEALAAATGNHALGELVRTIRGALLTARYPLARPQYRTERALPEHRRILKAIEKGDPDAARAAVMAHLKTIAGYLREHAAALAA
jgi:DNA-binding FadR family transcriptional regulator